MSILITRPSPAGEALVSRLRALGRVARSFPLIGVAGRELPGRPHGDAFAKALVLPFLYAVAFAHAQLQRKVAETGLRRRAISRLAAPRRSPFIPLAGSIFVIHWIGNQRSLATITITKILRANAR